MLLFLPKVVPNLPPVTRSAPIGNPLYTIEIRDQYGRLVDIIKNPQKKQFSLYRNRPGSGQFTLDLLDPQATPDLLQVNVYDVIFRRQGTPVFAGQIGYLDPVIDGDDKHLDVIATGYWDLFDQRYIHNAFPNWDSQHNQLPFVSTDVAQIGWDLVNWSQFPLYTDGGALVSGTSPLIAQSFISPSSSELTTIALLIKNESASGNLVVGLYDDQNGVPGNLVANSQQMVAASAISSSLDWYRLSYTNNRPALNNGQRYWIGVSMDTAQGSGNGIGWQWIQGDCYPAGTPYQAGDPSAFPTGTDLQFFVQLADQSFQQTKNTYLGIEQGNLPTTFNLAPTYAAYKKVKDAVEDLANSYNSFDFAIQVAIDPVTNLMTKTLNFYYPRQGVSNTALNFTYPGNIKKLEKSKNGKAMVNEVAMRGQGSGVDQTIVVVADQSSIQAYSQRQDVVEQSDVPDVATLTALGQEYIRLNKQPMDLPVLTLDGRVPPFLGSYGIGDIIHINILGNASIMSFSEDFRIEEIDSTIDDDDAEEISLTLSLA